MRDDELYVPEEDAWVSEIEAEYTGGSVDYYKVPITNPTTEGNRPYLAE